MNLTQQLITPLTIFVSLATACGILLHDTNADKAFVSVINSPVSLSGSDDTAKVRPSSTPHTHVERTSLSDTLRETSANPRTTPRNNDRKHLSQKRLTRGPHTSDGNRLFVDDLWH